MNSWIYTQNKKEMKKSKIKAPSKKWIEVSAKFIELCQNHIPEAFIKTRRYSEDILKELGVGYCSSEVISDLETIYKNTQWVEKFSLRKHTSRVIIPFDDAYFSSKLNFEKEVGIKNLFPKEEYAGSKKPFIIQGSRNKLALVEGETDAIALKHIFPEDSPTIVAVGGVQSSKNALEQIDLSEVENVLIAFDNDEPGKKATDEVVKELISRKINRIFLAVFPNEFKDVDELWRQNQEESKNILKIELHECSKISDRFKAPDLLNQIWFELEKTHKKDSREKLAVFIGCLTSESINPKERISLALKGESSSGKDSCVKTVLSHFPKEDSFILTRGTQSALEEEANKVKRIFFSEINQAREGANHELTEVFKQLSEGGTSVLKRDQNTHAVVRVESDQKTLIYGTTETETDDELQTRYVVIPIQSDEIKNKIVVDYYLDEAEKPTPKSNNESWICQGIRLLDRKPVIIPFAKSLKNCFDLTQDRIKRDVQRLLSLTKAVAWLHQKQRIEHEGFIYAEPFDWLYVVNIFEDFFTLTYNNLDARHDKLLKLIRAEEGKHDGDIIAEGFDDSLIGYAISEKVRKKSGLTRESFKRYINYLKNEGIVERKWFPEISKTTSLIKAGGSEVGHRRVIGGSAKSIDPPLTYLRTRSDLPSEYQKKEFSNVDLGFLDEIEKKSSETSFQNDPPQADPGQNLPKSVLNFFRKSASDTVSVSMLRKAFGLKNITNMMLKGELIEVRPGFLTLGGSS